MVLIITQSRGSIDKAEGIAEEDSLKDWDLSPSRALALGAPRLVAGGGGKQGRDSSHLVCLFEEASQDQEQVLLFLPF